MSEGRVRGDEVDRQEERERTPKDLWFSTKQNKARWMSVSSAQHGRSESSVEGTTHGSAGLHDDGEAVARDVPRIGEGVHLPHLSLDVGRLRHRLVGEGKVAYRQGRK